MTISRKITPQVFQKIKELNEKLRIEELRFRRQYLHLKAHLNDLVQKQLMDDYNIDFLVTVFSHDDDFNKRNHVETGDPFYESTLLCEGHFEKDERYFDFWNIKVYPGTGALVQLDICWSMYDILYWSDLSWEDTLAIDDVWLEIKVDYQFWTEKLNESSNPY